jgi:fibronectin-binding autotransporter adhesin
MKNAIGVVCAATVVGFLASITQADIVASGDINPADPTTWTSSTAASIGYQAGLVGAVTVNGGSDLISRYSYLGDQAGSVGVVTVDGFGSTWRPLHIYVGRYGDGTLNITDHGAVSGHGASIGYQAGSEGVVTVDGAGSTLTPSSGITVGYYGDATLNITDGGAVISVDDNAVIGYMPDSTGVVTVSGAGSTWTNSGDLSVGLDGAGTLNIADGGLVQATGSTYTGRYTLGTGSINFDNGTLTTGGFGGAVSGLGGTGTINTTGLVSDVDMVFDASHGLTQTFTIKDSERDITINLDMDGSMPMGVGYEGDGSMHIADGMTVQSTTGYMGYRSGSRGVVTVDGPGSTWSNPGALYVGSYGEGRLDILNGGTISSGSGVIGAWEGATGTVTVSGVGSTWAVNSAIVGYFGNGTLNITNGGTVNVINPLSTRIGGTPDSTGAVTVSGDSSTWTNSGDLHVGDAGDGTLDIFNGAAVSNTYCYIGTADVSTGVVTVDGPGSTWTNSSYLRIGEHGDGTLNITNGAVVYNKYCNIAEESGSTSTITVNGPGSTWTINGRIYIGVSGDGELNITNGGAVTSHTRAHIGSSLNSTSRVTVSGAGSTWIHSGEFLVGRSGNATLNIADGGLVKVTDCTYVAWNAYANGAVNFDNGTLTTGGFVGAVGDLSGIGTINTTGLVSDVDLVFDATHGLTQTLTVNDSERNITFNLDMDGLTPMGAGHGGEGSMLISDGLVVQSSLGYIGYQSGSTGVVTVDGTGSTWVNSSDNVSGPTLFVGREGDGALHIANGGAVSNRNAAIGHKPGSTGLVTVSGTGSTWTVSTSISVGEGGDGRLDITNSGSVSNIYTSIGVGPDTTSVVTVSGDGSTWDLSSTLRIGRFGNGTLNITNGAAVSNAPGIIGDRLDSTGTVTVSGYRATWTNSGDLTVGEDGHATLDITNGGAVSNISSILGNSFGATGLATVCGDGSTWTNFGDLTVGYNTGVGTLDITNRGLVSVGGSLTINDTYHRDNKRNGMGGGFINMTAGGMLALSGDTSGSLSDFLSIISVDKGTDEINYWDGSAWANITGATPDVDYTLMYLTQGDLAGYTLLTVPEPTTLAMLGIGALATLRRKRCVRL